MARGLRTHSPSTPHKHSHVTASSTSIPSPIPGHAARTRACCCCCPCPKHKLRSTRENTFGLFLSLTSGNTSFHRDSHTCSEMQGDWWPSSALQGPLSPSATSGERPNANNTGVQRLGRGVSNGTDAERLYRSAFALPERFARWGVSVPMLSPRLVPLQCPQLCAPQQPLLLGLQRPQPFAPQQALLLPYASLSSSPSFVSPQGVSSRNNRVGSRLIQARQKLPLPPP